MTGEALAAACAGRGIALTVDWATPRDPRETPRAITPALGPGDVLLVDLNREPAAVRRRVAQLLHAPHPRIVVLADSATSTLIEYTVDDVIGTDADVDQFIAAIEGTRPATIPAAQAPSELLTSREREVLDALLSGQDTGRMSEVLDISEHTVRTHLQNIFGKLGVNSRAEAIAWALRVDGPRAAPRESVSR